jgi:hypothetical protein
MVLSSLEPGESKVRCWPELVPLVMDGLFVTRLTLLKFLSLQPEMVCNLPNLKVQVLILVS